HKMLATGAAVTTALAQVDREKIYQWINELSSPETRENALLELSKKRESVPDLAPMLWHSCGTIAALLQVKGRVRLSRRPHPPFPVPLPAHREQNAALRVPETHQPRSHW
uniref:CCR4-NOT transcription complex subunit 9 n=1 Tax=Gadus morhua TaxID=8049 RepID=A0A8C5CWA9_GADMO